eukprot:GHVT01073976.1.p1 GENE.GHVT01073976.1~~GHVT01073976.1.p1  ORF type:complete len:457 (-),score=95.15 GHVT01073976.1:229-1599(-)
MEGARVGSVRPSLHRLASFLTCGRRLPPRCFRPLPNMGVAFHEVAASSEQSIAHGQPSQRAFSTTAAMRSLDAGAVSLKAGATHAAVRGAATQAGIASAASHAGIVSEARHAGTVSGAQGPAVEAIPEAVVVVGAGQMGTGIALTAARAAVQASFSASCVPTGRVCLVDVSHSSLRAASCFVATWLSSQREKSKLTAEEAAAIESVIRFGHLNLPSDLAAPSSSSPPRAGAAAGPEPSASSGHDRVLCASNELSDCDFVVEASPENYALKARLFAFLSSVVPPGAVLATNTSSISITRLAASVSKPERMLGVHFMNPVPVMPLVELVKGLQTNDSTVKRATAFARRMGKHVAVALDRPGFVANRILMPYINEAVQTLQDGVASVDDIDAILRLGANLPMGPLRLADFIGLDTCLSIMKILHQDFADSKYRPAPLLAQYVHAGWLGKKVKRGFYNDY